MTAEPKTLAEAAAPVVANVMERRASAPGGLYAALAAAQAEMGRALKDTQNPHFRTKYADLASVMDACMPALNRHGIAVIQPAWDDESGNRFVKTILVHGASGETAECRVPLIVSKNDMQGYGSAVTYARRYGLMGMGGIAPDDDDGQAAAKAPPRDERQADPQRRHPAQQAEASAPREDRAENVRKAAAYLGEAKDTEDLKRREANLMKRDASIMAEPAVIKARDFAAKALSMPDPAHGAAYAAGAPAAADEREPVFTDDEIPF